MTELRKLSNDSFFLKAGKSQLYVFIDQKNVQQMKFDNMNECILCTVSVINFVCVCGVCVVNNVVYELFNRKLYEEAYGLVEIICQELSKDCPSSFPVDRVRPAPEVTHLTHTVTGFCWFLIYLCVCACSR